MMQDWKMLLKNVGEGLGVLFKAQPATLKAIQAYDAGDAKHAVLDAKTRELIALAVAATTRCDTCIAIHANLAKDAGATREEILEALTVAIGLNAGAATVYASRILEAFDQLSAKN